MSWYSTKEDAQKACEWKTEQYGKEFTVVSEKVKLGNDDFDTEIWWAQRKP